MPKITSVPEAPREWNDLHKAASNNYGTHLILTLGAKSTVTPEELNMRDEIGMTPLMIAAQKGNLHGVMLLLASGADATLCDVDGWNALHHAAFYGKADSAKALIQDGRSLIGAQALGGSTPLHLAVAKNQDTVVDLLLRAGALLSTTDEYGRTPADIARKAKRKDLARKLAV